MSSPAGGKHKTLSLSEKMKLIEDHEKEKLTPRALIEKFKVGKTQVYATLKNKDKIMKEWMKGTAGYSVRVGKSSSNEVNEAVWEWFVKTRDQGLPISGPLIKAEALTVAQKLGKSTFKASNGWLESFKSRHNIVFGKLGLRAPPAERNENCWDQSFQENNVPVEEIVILTEGSYEDASPCDATTPSNPKTKVKRVAQNKKKLPVVFDEDGCVQQSSLVINKPTDEYSVFGEYVASELRQLHSEEKRRKLKRIIQRAIITTSEEDEHAYFKQITADSE